MSTRATKTVGELRQQTALADYHNPIELRGGNLGAIELITKHGLRVVGCYPDRDNATGRSFFAIEIEWSR